jgi:uncharacterized membrane protein
VQQQRTTSLVAKAQAVRPPQIVLLITLAVAAFALAYSYPQLPPVVASHFNASGAPNAWQPKGAFAMTLVILYLLFTLLWLSVPQLLRSVPVGLVNLPNREYWLAPQRRDHTAHVIGDQLAWLGSMQIALIAFIAQFAIDANLPGASGRLHPAVPWIAGAFVILLGAWLIRFLRMFSRPSG